MPARPNSLWSAAQAESGISMLGSASCRILQGFGHPRQFVSGQVCIPKAGRRTLRQVQGMLWAPPSRSNPRLRLHLRQHLMHEVNRDRSFADGRSHALHIAGPDIPHRKHPRQAGL